MFAKNKYVKKHFQKSLLKIFNWNLPWFLTPISLRNFSAILPSLSLENLVLAHNAACPPLLLLLLPLLLLLLLPLLLLLLMLPIPACGAAIGGGLDVNGNGNLGPRLLPAMTGFILCGGSMGAAWWPRLGISGVLFCNRQHYFTYIKNKNKLMNSYMNKQPMIFHQYALFSGQFSTILCNKKLANYKKYSSQVV